jgi:alpha-L-arabinofuranosidase
MMSPAGRFAGAALTVDPRPTFDLSPYLFMQFMEPLGLADGSVEAAWDFLHDRWREDLVEVTRELAPTLIRWPGGCFASYYRWKEGVGPRSRRKPMLNLCWGGTETNQVGTHEYIDFCRRVGADSLTVVNFESDGRKQWAHPSKGGVRSGSPREAAAWVDYCNNAKSPLRRRHGAREPFNVRLWQIGNETSYDPNGYDAETAARRTVAFARAMRRADPDIKLIGWGEWRRETGGTRRMLEVAGEHLQYLAFHHGIRSTLPDSPLEWDEYRKDPARTWEHLMSAYRSTEEKLGRMREEVAGFPVTLALTESHFSAPGRHRSEVLASWGAGVAYARVLNVHIRNGDLLKIATMADFCGTSWMTNAVMIPRGGAYMMPVARVMALARRHIGTKALTVLDAPPNLDVTASRKGKRIYLYVVNTSATEAVEAHLAVPGMSITSGRAFQIADDPMRQIDQRNPDLFSPTEHQLPARASQGTTGALWTFPPASVTAVELEVASLGSSGGPRRG